MQQQRNYTSFLPSLLFLFHRLPSMEIAGELGLFKAVDASILFTEPIVTGEKGREAMERL